MESLSPLQRQGCKYGTLSTAPPFAAQGKRHGGRTLDFDKSRRILSLIAFYPVSGFSASLCATGWNTWLLGPRYLN